MTLSRCSCEFGESSGHPPISDEDSRCNNFADQPDGFCDVCRKNRSKAKIEDHQKAEEEEKKKADDQQKSEKNGQQKAEEK